MTTLETERLILRPFRLDDFENFVLMSADAEVAQSVTPDGKPLSRFAAWHAMCAIAGHWALRGFGMFAVIERSTGALVGHVGPSLAEGWPDFEIGWVLSSRYWGRGYATEAASKCIEYAFTELNRSHLVSLIFPENLRSIRVAERVGESLEKTVTLPHRSPDRPCLQYGLTRDEWKRRRNA